MRAKAGEQIDFDGKVHSTHWAPAVTPTRESIPVYQAAIYPKMLKVAARHADGLALGALLSAAYIRDVVRPAVVSAADEHGRDPGEIGFLGSMMVSVQDDADAARNVTVRQSAASTRRSRTPTTTGSCASRALPRSPTRSSSTSPTQPGRRSGRPSPTR